MTILYFILALGILVLVHEWGHFIVARRAGIRVEKFSIGFGPKLFGVRRGDTEYCVSLLPLGGYVKLFGEDPVAEAEGDEVKARSIAASPDAFSAQSLSVRLATVLAGPGMNLVLCLFLMPLVFMIGRSVPVILERPPVVLGVLDDSPASKAGLTKDDRILEIDGRKMDRWSDVVNWTLLHPDSKVDVVIDRGGRTQSLMVETTMPPDSKEKMGFLGIEPHYFWGNEAVIGVVHAGSPASKVDILEGDLIRSIDGLTVPSWTHMTEVIRASNGKRLTVTLERSSQIKTVEITPVYDESSKIWMMGVTKKVNPDDYVLKHYGPLEAVVEGTRENIKLLVMTGDVLGRLLTFQLSYKALGGPVQIAQVTGAAARSGMGSFLYFVAFLSLQLGILNLLPIPVLDGGHVLFMTIEGIRQKPVSLKVRSAATQTGLFLLLSLMVLITINDIDRVWGFSSLWEKIRGIF